MTDRPIEQLDAHRGMAAQKQTETRRRVAAVQRDQAELQERRTQLEDFLLAAPASSWPEAAARASYLIELFAATPEAQDPRRQKLIADVLDDLVRLTRADAGRHSDDPPTTS